MAETLDIIEKLIRLASNNPNEAEATAAARKAVQLIHDNHIPLGHAGPTRKKAAWTQQEEESFKETLSAMMVRVNPDEFVPETVYPSFDIDDGFMKRRITEAWRMVRVARQQVEAEYRRLHWPIPKWGK